MKKLFVISLFLLAGCSKTYEGMTSGIAADSSSIREKIADNISPEDSPHRGKGDGGKYTYPPAYCYKSWSGNVCYDKPAPDKE